MNIENLQSEWSKDSIIDEVNLAQESLSQPALHSKYYNEYLRTKFSIIACDKKMLQLKRKKWLKYKGYAEIDPFELILSNKDEINLFIESDDEYLEENTKLRYLQEKIMFLDSILKTISQRSFCIKNAIEFQKFQNGVI